MTNCDYDPASQSRGKGLGRILFRGNFDDLVKSEISHEIFPLTNFSKKGKSFPYPGIGAFPLDFFVELFCRRVSEFSPLTNFSKKGKSLRYPGKGLSPLIFFVEMIIFGTTGVKI